MLENKFLVQLLEETLCEYYQDKVEFIEDFEERPIYNDKLITEFVEPIRPTSRHFDFAKDSFENEEKVFYEFSFERKHDVVKKIVSEIGRNEIVEYIEEHYHSLEELNYYCNKLFDLFDNQKIDFINNDMQLVSQFWEMVAEEYLEQFHSFKELFDEIGIKV